MNFVKCPFCISWDNHVVFLNLINIIYYVDFITTSGMQWNCSHLLLLTILQLYHLPPPLLLPVSNCSCLFTPCEPCMPAVVLFKALYWKIQKCFLYSLYLLLFIICVKSIINVLQYNSIIADYASWVPKLTLLDLQTNWTYKHTLGKEIIHM